MRPGRWVLPFAFAVVFPLTAAAAEPVVSDAWSRAMPPVSKVGAAYLVVSNPGDEARRLVGASSDIAARVELHTHEMANGMMQMRQVENVEVPPKGEVVFKPHGLHLMLFDLKRALVAGERFTVELEFADGSKVKAEAEIRDN